MDKQQNTTNHFVFFWLIKTFDSVEFHLYNLINLDSQCIDEHPNYICIILGHLVYISLLKDYKKGMLWKIY